MACPSKVSPRSTHGYIIIIVCVPDHLIFVEWYISIGEYKHLYIYANWKHPEYNKKVQGLSEAGA